MAKKVFKALLWSGLILIMSISSAKAILIDSVTPVPGGAVISDFVSVGLSSSGITYGGGPTGLASGGSLAAPLAGLLDTGSLTNTAVDLNGGTFSVLNPFTINPLDSLVLTGNFLDYRESVGLIEILFSVTGGSVAGDFGSLVVLSLASPDFAAGTIAGLSSLSNIESTSAILTVSSVTAIPIPAAISKSSRCDAWPSAAPPRHRGKS